MSSTGELAVQVARFAEEHIAAVLRLEEESYTDPWSEGMLRQELTNHASHFYVLLEENTIIGYGGFWLLIDEAHITKLTVAEAFRRKGLGAGLLQFLLRRAIWLGAATVRLEVRESNVAARKLYECTGFKPVGVRKGYYARSNENAIVMLKTLNEP